MFGMILAGVAMVADEMQAQSDESKAITQGNKDHALSGARVEFSRKRNAAAIEAEVLIAADNATMDKQEVEQQASIIKSKIATEAAVSGTIGGSVDMALDDVDNNATQQSINIDKRLNQQHKQLSANMLDLQYDADGKVGDFKVHRRSKIASGLTMASTFMNTLQNAK